MLFEEKRMICSLSIKRNENRSPVGFSNGNRVVDTKVGLESVKERMNKMNGQPQI